MCWPIEEMKALGKEYPELEKLATVDAKSEDIDMDEQWDALGEAAGMWYDYGLEDFQNMQARRNVAIDLIGFLKKNRRE